MEMTVSNAAAFVSDPAVLQAMRRALATVAGVFEEHVTVTLELARRRLQGALLGRRLNTGAVAVSVTYAITIPSVTPSGLLATGPSVQEALTDPGVESIVTDAVVTEVNTAVGNGIYVIVVTAVPEPTVTTDESTTSPLNGLSRSAASAMAVARMSHVLTAFLLAVVAVRP
jgi:hypothetical protein